MQKLKPRMKKSILTVIVLFASLSGFSQGFLTFTDNGWDFHIGLGVSNTNLGERFDAFKLDSVYGNDESDLNNANAPVTFPKPSSQLYLASLGGYGCSSGIIYGAEVSYGMASPVEKSYPNRFASQSTQSTYTLKTSYYTTAVMVQLGLIAYRNNLFVIYPYGGLGYGGSAIRVASNQPGNKVYPIMSTGSEKDNKVLWNANLSYEFGVGADFLFGKGGDGAQGFKLGLRIGMFQQVPGYNLKSNGEKIQDDIKNNPTAVQYNNPHFYQHLTHNTTPITNEDQLYKKLGLTAPYVKLIIGVGHVAPKKK